MKSNKLEEILAPHDSLLEELKSEELLLLKGGTVAVSTAGCTSGGGCSSGSGCSSGGKKTEPIEVTLAW